jgi:hypothetical protein
LPATVAAAAARELVREAQTQEGQVKRKILAVLAGGVVLAVATGFAPTNSDPHARLAKVDTAIGSHGIQLREGTLTHAALHYGDEPRSAYRRYEAATRSREANITRESPPLLDPLTGLYIPDVHADALLDVVVYKSAADAKRHAKRDWFDDGDHALGYLYRGDTLITIGDSVAIPPEMEQAFRATMTDLRARPVFEGPLR